VQQLQPVGTRKYEQEVYKTDSEIDQRVRRIKIVQQTEDIGERLVSTLAIT
jgi:hypothetical protein